ncbi:MAG: hypothetical protein U0640_12490 [Phycisphaerales bacterium]
MSAGLCACSSPQQPTATTQPTQTITASHTQHAPQSIETAPSPAEFIKKLEEIAAWQRNTSNQQSDAWKQLKTLVQDTSRDTSNVARAAWSISDKPIEFAHADRHALSLDEALAAIKSAGTPLGETPSKPSTDRPESVRAYTSAKSRVLAGDTNGAITELENALQKDPESLTLQSELGMLQIRAGRRTAGLATLRRAIDQGLRDPKVLRTLAREEGRSGNTDQALVLLAAAIESPALESKSLEAALIRTELGERLFDAEYFTAARTVLAELATVNTESFGAADLRSLDASDLLRRRPALLMLAGDLCVLQQQWTAATDCYIASMTISAQSSPQSRLRLAGVSLRTGQTAQAALQLLNSLADNKVPQPWHDEVTRALRADSQVSEQLRLALLSSIASQPPTTRMTRVTLASSTMNSNDAASSLERAMTEFAPTDFALDRLLDALDGDTSQPMNVERVCDSLSKICDAHPDDAHHAADALVRNGRSIQSCHAKFASHADKSISNALIAASLSLFYNDPQGALDTLNKTTDASRPEVQISRVQGLMQLGQSDEARRIADSLDVANTTPLHKTLAYLATNQPEKAQKSLAGQLESSSVPNTNIATLIAASEAAARTGDIKTASNYLSRASEIDPASDHIAARRFTLVTSDEKHSDEQAAAIIIRDLRDINPSSRWLRQLLAQDLSQRGLAKAAQSELDSLVDDRGEPSASLGMQVDLWIKDKSSLNTAVQRVTNQLRARPDSPSLTIALSRLLAASNRPQDAHDLLATQYEKFPLDEFARPREDLLRNQLGNPDEADRLLVARLQKRPMDFATGIEMTQSLFSGGSYQRGTESLRTLLAANQSLTPDQLKSMSGLLNFLSPAALTKANPDAHGAALDAVDLLNARGAITTVEHASDRAELISIVRPTQAGEILDAIDQVIAIDKRYRPVIINKIAQRLFALENATPGLRLLEELNMRTEPPNEMLGREWILQTITRGGLEDVKRLVKNWKDGEHLAQSLAQLQLSPDFAGEPIDESRAEFAYFMGNLLSNMGRDALSAEVYRFVFELDPKHAWASNNLGYMILERGGSIEEAARLLEQAHEGEPDASSIIDSLGWLRYKQGHIEDWTDANGVKQEGAITLIERALQNPDGESNWEMQDHLADALWRRNQGDDRDRAKRCWRAASALIRDTLSFTQFGNVNPKDQPPLVVEMMQRQKEIDAKVAATFAGDEPSISEMSIPKEFKPRPEPVRERILPNQPARQMLMP